MFPNCLAPRLEPRGPSTPLRLSGFHLCHTQHITHQRHSPNDQSPKRKPLSVDTLLCSPHLLGSGQRRLQPLSTMSPISRDRMLLPSNKRFRYKQDRRLAVRSVLITSQRRRVSPLVPSLRSDWGPHETSTLLDPSFKTSLTMPRLPFVRLPKRTGNWRPKESNQSRWSSERRPVK